MWAVLSIVLVTSCSPQQSDDNWNKTVKTVSSGIVSIQMDVPVSFDGKWNSSTYATGFVVDADKGIILTNRHVVTPGPVTAKAILINNEEIDLTPLYIDPVHDFGFYQYQPSQIKHLQPHQFKLSKSEPHVGQDIRIIGNDAGQKVSILDGTISRLDRDAPNYGRGKYNDFNTFYIQAATSSSGGSSGAPVINVKGEVIALNAGSQTKSATSFFVPLDKVKLALEKLQNKQPIRRGTIQTTFISTPYAELARLGLNEELSSQYRSRQPELNSLLVIRSIIPQSPAAKKLAVGDILLKVNDQPTTDFSTIESLFDQHINQNINITILRKGEEFTFPITVSDLANITPSSYLKFDGGIFHDLSYQQARHFNKPISGVYLANSGYLFKQAGVAARSVITEFNGTKINNIREFDTQLRKIKNGTKVNLRYFDFSTPNTTNYALVEIDRKWFEHSMCHKSPEMSYWPCVESTAKTNLEEQVPNKSTHLPLSITDDLEDALVQVNFNSPYSIQGRSGSNSRSGTGVIVDVAKGWVVVPRSVVLSMLGDVKLVFKNRLEISGKVEYIHPIHNLALVSYIPSQLTDVNVAQIKMNNQPLKAGDPVLQMGLNYDGIIEYRETTVDSTEELWASKFNVPKYVDSNIQGTYLVNGNSVIDGVLANTNNEVIALWTSFDESDSSGKESDRFKAGMSVDYVEELMTLASNNQAVYSLDINLTQIPPVDAIQMGLSKEWLSKLMQTAPDSNKLLAIYNVAAASSSAEVFKRSDILLAINNTPVTSFRQVEKLTQSPEVTVTYFSEGKVETAVITPTPLFGHDIKQVFFWSGLYLHAPHRAAQIQGNVGATGLYVASYNYGSPASRYAVYAMQRIVEIDGMPIKTTSDFINAVKGKQHRASVLIKTLNFNNIPKVTTLRVDNNYWPFYEFTYHDGQWQRINHLDTDNDR
jgi:S1-C subfamily serine protease